MKLTYPCYIKRSNKELLNAIEECKTLMRLSDWDIELVTQPLSDDKEVDGEVEHNLSRMEANIYIDHVICKEQNEDPLCILLHEMAHILQRTYDHEMEANLIGLFTYHLLESVQKNL